MKTQIVFALVCCISTICLALSGCKPTPTELAKAPDERWDKYTKIAKADSPESKRLRQLQLNKIQTFFMMKEQQAHDLAKENGEKFLDEAQSFFDAGIKADWRKMNSIYWNIRKRSYHFEGTQVDARLTVTYWQCINESYCAYEQVASGEPKYVQAMVDDVINSIPLGGIYFGGTDPGRFLISAFSKSHVKGDSFFTLTANALADGLYLKYLSNMYGAKIYIPTPEDSQRCFNYYLEGAQERFRENKLKPGEDLRIIDGKVQISGQAAVMGINALLAKTVFDKNPDRELFIEEGFPLDWMYPHLEPHGLILKINRKPLKEISEKLVQEDREYWQPHMVGMTGDWLNEDTSVKTVIEFAEKVYHRKDLKDFKGDAQFVQNEDSQKTFSKLRASIGGVYAWRVANAVTATEQSRMIRAADFAFRQAVALSPNSPEAVYRFVNLLLSQSRVPDAILVAETARKLDPQNTSFKNLVAQIEQMQKPNDNTLITIIFAVILTGCTSVRTEHSKSTKPKVELRLLKVAFQIGVTKIHAQSRQFGKGTLTMMSRNRWMQRSRFWKNAADVWLN